MSIFLLLTVLVVGAEPRTALDSAKPSRDEAEARRLIQQLASDSFSQREAATKALRSLGEKAIPALKRATASQDPEVRRRAVQLLTPLEAKVRRRAIEAIRASKLSPVEKGRRLKAFITEGMTQQAVEKSIGSSQSIWSIRGDNGGCVTIVIYKRYALVVSFITPVDSDISRLHEVRIVEQEPDEK